MKIEAENKLTTIYFINLVFSVENNFLLAHDDKSIFLSQ